MDSKVFVFIGLTLGSAIGGYIPYLWGGNMFSFSSIILSGLGAMAGIWAGYTLSKRI